MRKAVVYRLVSLILMLMYCAVIPAATAELTDAADPTSILVAELQTLPTSNSTIRSMVGFLVFEYCNDDNTSEEGYRAFRDRLDANGNLAAFEATLANFFNLRRMQEEAPALWEYYISHANFYNSTDTASDTRELNTKYADNPLPQKALTMLKPQQETLFEYGTVFWFQEDFEQLFGKTLKKFRPAQPRPNHCVLIVENGSQLGIDGDDIHTMRELKFSQYANILDRLVSCFAQTDRRFFFEGNPDHAAIIIRIRIEYPDAGYYRSNALNTWKSVHAYNLKITLTASDAKGKTIETMVIESVFGSSLTASSNTVWKSIPDLTQHKTVGIFVNNVLTWAKKQKGW